MRREAEETLVAQRNMHRDRQRSQPRRIDNSSMVCTEWMNNEAQRGKTGEGGHFSCVEE